MCEKKLLSLLTSSCEYLPDSLRTALVYAATRALRAPRVVFEAQRATLTERTFLLAFRVCNRIYGLDYIDRLHNYHQLP